MKTSQLTKFALPLVAALTGSSHAAVIIDNFTDVNDTNPMGRLAVTVQTLPDPIPVGGANTNSAAELGLASVIGGSRTLSITRTLANGGGDRRITGTISDPAPAFFQYESTSGANGFAELVYGASSPLNADLSAETTFRIAVASYDAPNSLPLVATISVESGTGNGSTTLNFSGVPGDNGGGPINFNFNDPGFTGVDFADIDKITVRFNPNQGGDFDINSITAVPEPGSTLLLLLGVVGCSFTRRRR